MTKSVEEIKQISENKGYCFIDTYIGDKGRQIILSDSYGYKYNISLKHMRNCEKFGIVDIRNPYSLENISNWISINNKNISITENNKVYNGSNTKLEFYCYECDDYFYMAWENLLQNTGCGVCRGLQTGKYHSLEYLRPDLMNEWDYELNEHSPATFTCGSGKSVHWICKECGHRWQATIGNRTHLNSGCPSCAGQIVSDKNRLSILFPNVAKEWHPTKNGELKPENFSFGCNRNVWWKCKKCGHEWMAKINNRSLNGSNCPSCNESVGEKRIHDFAKKNNIKITVQKRYNDCRYKNSLPFDIYFDDYDILTEYHGEQHYLPIDFAGRGEKWAKKQFKENKKKDKIKENYCKKNKIKLIIIPYWEFDNIEKILTRKLKIK